MSSKPNLNILDDLLRRGQVPTVKNELRSISKGDLRDEERVLVASLWRRCHDSNEALKVLYPVVRPKDPTLDHSNDAQKVEYALNLLRVGVMHEAQALLTRLKVKSAAALFVEATGLIQQWRYRDSVPVLESYLDLESDPYKQKIGELNLVPGLIVSKRYAEAEMLLSKLLESSKTEGQRLLYGNALELSAQLAFQTQDYAKAKALLEDAKRALLATELLDELFVEKWAAYVAAVCSKSPSEQIEILQAFRAKAFRKMHWESVRDTDRLQAVLTRDEALRTHLYFGTPYEIFRDDLLADCNVRAELPQTYVWCPGADDTSRIDLIEGVPFQVGQGAHAFLCAIAADFYKPASVGTLFSRLFEAEVYNPLNSPNRVHQHLKRLRKQLSELGLPLTLEETGGRYRFSPTSQVSLLIPKESNPTKPAHLLTRLSEQWGDKEFSVREAAKLLDVSVSSVTRQLRDGVSNDKVVKSGAGKNTLYRIK